jgi:hypothetical protein
MACYKFNFNDIENKIFKSFEATYEHDEGSIEKYKACKKLLKKYRKYMYDENQTETTRQKLLNEREYNYDLKLHMISYLNMRQNPYRSYNSMQYISKDNRQLRRLNIQKKNHKLNTLLIKRLKQQYLKVISPLLLPHDLENLIIEYLI